MVLGHHHAVVTEFGGTGRLTAQDGYLLGCFEIVGVEAERHRTRCERGDSCSADDPAAIDDQGLAIDHPGLVGCQPHHSVGDFARVDQPARGCSRRQ